MDEVPRPSPLERGPLTLPLRIRAVWNAVNGSTLAGLLLASAGRSRFRRGPRGLVFAEHYKIRFPKAGAFVLGNVVLTPHTMQRLEDWHPGTFAHEDTHATQYAWMLGLPYLPTYWLLCGWSWLRTGDVASANFFERNAGLVRGGYHERPKTNAGLKKLGRPLRRRPRHTRPL